jgi:DNA-binding MarR family transcriptional regulator
MVKHLTNPLQVRPVPLGTLLSSAGHRLAAELDASLAEAGFADLRAAHAPVFMAIEPDGSRVTDLAVRTRMTKQAMGELVRYLTERGYVSVTTDESDRRVKRVALTDRGWAVVDTGERVIADFDRWLESSVGGDAVNALRDTLVRIIETDPSQRA